VSFFVGAAAETLLVHREALVVIGEAVAVSVGAGVEVVADAFDLEVVVELAEGEGDPVPVLAADVVAGEGGFVAVGVGVGVEHVEVGAFDDDEVEGVLELVGEHPGPAVAGVGIEAG
jgi:hypothetical protein